MKKSRKKSGDKFGGGRRMAVTSNCVNEKRVFSSWNPERRPEPFQFLSTYTSALPNEGCGSSQSQILLFFGYCTPNCIQYSWGT